MVVGGLYMIRQVRAELQHSEQDQTRKKALHHDRVTAYWLAQHGYDCYVKAFRRMLTPRQYLGLIPHQL